MYGYHLWIDLAETTEESDCGALEQKAAELQLLVREKLRCKPADCIFDVNGSKVWQCSGSTNHRGSAHAALLDVLQFVIEKLPGSHGLVYWSDDERTDKYEGVDRSDVGYRVIVIARGQMHERFDPFLSPRNPVVED